MKVETHSDPAVFDELYEEWNALLHPERPASLFLSADWQRLWWACLGRGELNVVTMRVDAGKLVGVAPLFLEQVNGRPTLALVGCVDVTDYLDVLAAPDHAEMVIGGLVDYLDGDAASSWEAIDLCSIPYDSEMLEHLPRFARARGWGVEVSVQDVVPVVPLPDTFEGYLEGLDGKQRRELRRKLRRAESWNGGVGWYTVGPQHDLIQEREAFLRLMAMSDPQKAEFLAERGNRAFFEQLTEMAARLGWLHLQFLTAGEERVAGLFNLQYGDRMMVYNSGFNFQEYAALSPGWVLLGFSIEDAVKHGLKNYDFLRGEEDYKLRLGGQPTTVHRILVQRTG